MLAGERNQGRQRVLRPQHVGDLGNGQQAGPLIKQRRNGIQLQGAVRSERDNPQLGAHPGTEHLPGDDVRVVLHGADDDVIAGADVGIPPAIGHQIDPFGGPPDEDQLFR